MNQLFDYGIQKEQSDIRAHVCPKVRRVYVFPTEEGRKALAKGVKLPAYQPGVEGPTALGHCVPVWCIRKCVCLQVKPAAWDAIGFSPEDDTSVKGHKAVRLVVGMIQNGLFPLPLTGSSNASLSPELEIAGEDIRVSVNEQTIAIQVKCDYPGGAVELGGTGNLYLQTAECNPLSKR
jgi:hypothetical protein